MVNIENTEGEVSVKFILLALILLMVDGFCKSLIYHVLDLGEELNTIGTFKITHVHNYGIAWGVGQHIHPRIYVILTILVISFLGKMYIKKQMNYELISYMLITVGGMGNAIDRLIYGHVIDMLKIHPSFPVFNLADVYITSGVFVYIVGMYLHKKKQDNIKISNGEI